MEKVEQHVYFLAARCFRNWKYRLNADFVKKGRLPFIKYNTIDEEIWEEFCKRLKTPEAKAKSEKFT